MQRYSIEPRTRKYVKGYGFLSFPKKITITGYRARCCNNHSTKKTEMKLDEILDKLRKVL